MAPTVANNLSTAKGLGQIGSRPFAVLRAIREGNPRCAYFL
jgi:hypothetical protein